LHSLSVRPRPRRRRLPGNRRNQPVAKAISGLPHGKEIVNRNPAADPTVSINLKATINPTATDVPRETAKVMEKCIGKEIDPIPSTADPWANPAIARGKSVSPFFVTE